MKDFDPDILPGASVLSQVNIERLFRIQRHSVLSIPVLVYPPSSLVKVLLLLMFYLTKLHQEGREDHPNLTDHQPPTE